MRNRDEWAKPSATDTPLALNSHRTRTTSEGFCCVNIGNPSLLSILQSSITEGKRLLIEDVDSTIDPVLDPILCHRTYTKVSITV